MEKKILNDVLIKSLIKIINAQIMIITAKILFSIPKYPKANVLIKTYKINANLKYFLDKINFNIYLI